MEKLKKLEYKEILDSIPEYSLKKAVTVTAVVVFQFVVAIPVLIAVFTATETSENLMAPSGLETFFYIVAAITFISFFFPVIYNRIANTKEAITREVKSKVNESDSKEEMVRGLMKIYVRKTILNVILFETAAFAGMVFLVMAYAGGILEYYPGYWLAVLPIVMFLLSVYLYFPSREKAADFLKNKIIGIL